MTQTIGFIGLGVLGSAVAKNLIEGGLNVVGCDVSSAARQHANELGISLVNSPQTLATQVDVIFTCLPSAESLRDVVSGPHGITKVAVANQPVIDMSTLTLADKEEFANACTAAGRIPIDCPVSGNRIMALNKKLTAFFSGETQVFQQMEQVLGCFCSKIHYVGAFGNGIKVKLCGNILNLVHNSVAAEAMVLAIKSGLDPKMFHEVISGSGSSSAMFEVRGAMMVDEDYQKESMNMSVPLKDARIISEHAAQLSCPLPIYQVALQNYYAAAAQGHVNDDAAVVCRIMERAANAMREPMEPKHEPGEEPLPRSEKP